jgi:hypothetical protein
VGVCVRHQTLHGRRSCAQTRLRPCRTWPPPSNGAAVIGIVCKVHVSFAECQWDALSWAVTSIWHLGPISRPGLFVAGTQPPRPYLASGAAPAENFGFSLRLDARWHYIRCAAHHEHHPLPCRHCPPLGASAGPRRPAAQWISAREVLASPRGRAREGARNVPTIWPPIWPRSSRGGCFRATASNSRCDDFRAQTDPNSPLQACEPRPLSNVHARAIRLKSEGASLTVTISH